jgi:hypothetical protein
MRALNLTRRWILPLASACLLMSSAPALAQRVGYSTVSVKGRVQLEVPDDWTISDAEHRKRVKELGEKLSGVKTQYTASLAVQSFPVPSRMFVRVSFVKLEPAISQEDVRKEVQADRLQVVRDLANTWKDESPVMWAALAKNGIKEVGSPGFAVEPLGSQTALVIRYGRTSTVNLRETVRVAQYHVPLGAEKALITLSYIEGDPGAVAAHDRLKKSILIR